MTTVDFYFDPICPWCWITSRWLRDVADQRDVEARWRPFSLLVKNYEMEGGHGNEEYRHRYAATHDFLRLIEAARADHGEAAADALYLETGRRIHHDKERWPDPADLLAATGLPATLAPAVADAAWDEPIRTSMDRAIEIAGYDVGVPLLVFDGERGFFGPVFSPRPVGQSALDVFDAIEVLAGQPGFWELKRGRDVGPDIGERP
jgi:hypothetical protein